MVSQKIKNKKSIGWGKPLPAYAFFSYRGKSFLRVRTHRRSGFFVSGNGCPFFLTTRLGFTIPAWKSSIPTLTKKDVLQASISHEEPSDYHKWIPDALLAAEMNYPNAALVDYLFFGSKPLSESTSTYFYKFQMRQGPDEFEVHVAVTVNLTTGKIIQTSSQRKN